MLVELLEEEDFFVEESPDELLVGLATTGTVGGYLLEVEGFGPGEGACVKSLPRAGAGFGVRTGVFTDESEDLSDFVAPAFVLLLLSDSAPALSSSSSDALFPLAREAARSKEVAADIPIAAENVRASAKHILASWLVQLANSTVSCTTKPKENPMVIVIVCLEYTNEWTTEKKECQPSSVAVAVCVSSS